MCPAGQAPGPPRTGVKPRGHRELVSLVSHAAAISAGEWVTATGNWVNDRTHGQQFKARFLKTSAPTSIEGIEKYLASGMIGSEGAARVSFERPGRVRTRPHHPSGCPPPRLTVARAASAARLEAILGAVRLGMDCLCLGHVFEPVLFLDPTNAVGTRPQHDASARCGKPPNTNEPGARPTATAPTLARGRGCARTAAEVSLGDTRTSLRFSAASLPRFATMSNVTF